MECLMISSLILETGPLNSSPRPCRRIPSLSCAASMWRPRPLQLGHSRFRYAQRWVASELSKGQSV
eukprot:4758931-Pyramimonas_sp.AAC.1